MRFRAKAFTGISIAFHCRSQVVMSSLRNEIVA